MEMLAIVGTVGSHAYGWGHSGAWMLAPLVFFWLIAAGAALFCFSRGARLFGVHERHGIERAMDILAERFAEGELSAEEYQQRLSQLR